MKRLIIIGASGHGKVVADLAKKSGYDNVVFLDNDSSIATCVGYSVLGPDYLVSNLEGDICIAVGNAEVRERIMVREKGRNFPVLIHPNAIVADNVEIGEGSVVMAGVVVNPDTKIGRGVIVNTSSSIDHDCVIEDFVHISVGAHLCGTVHVGKKTWIGAGTTVSNNITICSDCMIGAGTVVIKDIIEAGTYVGVPARIIKGRP